MTENGKATRLNTYVDIPTEIGLPHFIQDDNMDADGPLYGNFKLSLQAFVCHRGKSVDSGHYIAIVRGTSAGATPATPNSPSQSTDDPSRYWMRFDDLAQERVTLVDVEKALRTESPYLLFYQILPIDEDAAEANLRNKHTSSFSSGSNPDSDVAGVSQSLLNLSTVATDVDGPEGSVIARPSFEITGPDNAEPRPSVLNGRRRSAFSETANSNGNLQLNDDSLMTPDYTPKEEGGRSSFSFSRRGSRVSKSNPGSRDGSQASDSRFSTAFSRFAGLLSRDKSSDESSIEDDDGDGPAIEHDEGKPASSGEEKKEKSTGRRWSKDRGKSKDKNKTKEKSKDKVGKKKLDRECVVM